MHKLIIFIFITKEIKVVLILIILAVDMNIEVERIHTILSNIFPHKRPIKILTVYAAFLRNWKIRCRKSNKQTKIKIMQNKNNKKKL